MSNYQIVIGVKGNVVLATLECVRCTQVLCTWEGFVGILHLPVDDINDNTFEHECEKG